MNGTPSRTVRQLDIYRGLMTLLLHSSISLEHLEHLTRQILFKSQTDTNQYNLWILLEFGF